MYPCVRPVHSVLVVDDDDRVVSEYARALRPRTVRGTTDAAVALEVARHEKPELALIELRLENQPAPAMLGLTTQRRPVCGTDLVTVLHGSCPEMRIVMISAGRAWHYSLEARAAGAEGMLCKSYGARRIITIIEGDRLRDHDKPAAEPMSLRRKEHEYIAEVFVATGRNVFRTAEILDIERSTLKRKLRENIVTTFDDTDAE